MSKKLSAPATVYGFATWWSAELTPGIVLSTAPPVRTIACRVGVNSERAGTEMTR